LSVTETAIGGQAKKGRGSREGVGAQQVQVQRNRLRIETAHQLSAGCELCPHSPKHENSPEDEGALSGVQKSGEAFADACVLVHLQWCELH